jgi:hypothetical protein
MPDAAPPGRLVRIEQPDFPASTGHRMTPGEKAVLCRKRHRYSFAKRNATGLAIAAPCDVLRQAAVFLPEKDVIRALTRTLDKGAFRLRTVEGSM